MFAPTVSLAQTNPGAQREMNSISIRDNGNNNSGIIIAQRGRCLPLVVFGRWQAGYALDMNSLLVGRGAPGEAQ